MSGCIQRLNEAETNSVRTDTLVSYGLVAAKTLDIQQLCRLLSYFKQNEVAIRKIALKPGYFLLEFLLAPARSSFITELEQLWTSLGPSLEATSHEAPTAKQV